MSTRPGEGERRAASGYRSQYLVSAKVILEELNNGDLEWVRLADPEVGRVDDLQIATTARVDGYQVKWKQYGGTITLRDLVRDTDGEPSLIGQLADGWRRLRKMYPGRRVVVHLVINAIPSSATSAWMPKSDSPPAPYHLAAFIEQAWCPTQRRSKLDAEGEWAAVWDEIRNAGDLSPDALPAFVLDCSLDFQTILPEENADILALSDLLFATAAGAERIVELGRVELLQRLGWTHRYVYRNVHEFPAPPFLYRPIRSTVDTLEAALTRLPGGYVGMFGPPGSGKSTLLTRTLRALPLRLIRYYAYVPEAQDPSVLRGESNNFLHDVTLRLQKAGIGRGKRPDPSDRSAMLALFHKQLQILGEDHAGMETKTVILIDGLDHIAREQHPDRSLLSDLPLPDAVPDGVYIVLGSQTNELPDLPSPVHHILRQQGRRIEMDRLSPSAVHAIVEEAVPTLEADERQRVFELSSGHPLALIYLLKYIGQTKRTEEHAELLEDAIPYEGDIETQYWGHWRVIEYDDTLVHALGLLARVRGSVPMRWVWGWLDTTTFRKLRPLLLQYFEEEGQERWGFFHNSFRLFLMERTAEPLPGQTPEQQNQAYHRELAELFEASPAPWQWEALYHRYSAGEYDAVVAMASPEWFREQIEALRPLDAVQTDARLALQSAGVRRDVVALARLTLVGATLEQRASTLEDSSLPDLLLRAGEAVQAAEQLRDGNRLRVGAEQALRLGARLVDAGLLREGQRVFELAEPLELLSGRPIPDDHTPPRDLWDLLRAWTRSAIIFRGPDETAQVIRRIRSEPARNEKESAEQVSRRLQNGLLRQGALACCERGDWAGWQTLFDTLDDEQDRLMKFFTLLRSAERAQRAMEICRAQTLLQELLATFQLHDLGTVDEKRWRLKACLDVAELTLRLTEDKEGAQTWARDLPPIPLQDRSIHRENEPSLHELRFRWTRLRYLCGETRSPEALLSEAESHTEFGEHTGDEEKMGRRQIALVVFQLARLWTWGYEGHCLEPAAFLQGVCWILDLFGPGWEELPLSFRMSVTAARSEVLRYMVSAAAEQSNEVVAAVRDELEARWTNPDEGDTWWPNLQRELIVALTEVGADRAWAKAQLYRIEPIMLRDLEPYSGVEACEAQAEAWLALGEREMALTELRRMVQAAGGILSEKDYQLPIWVNWLGRINELEPDRATGRIRLMLHRILSVQNSAAGVGDAAEELLEVVFRWSPRRAVRLLKSLLEHHIVGHQSGVTRILTSALSAEGPPVKAIIHSVVDLILPLVPGTEPGLLEELIVRTSGQLGHDAALDAARYLVCRIEADALANQRATWCRGVAAGLRAIGCVPDYIGLHPSQLEDQPRGSGSDLDRDLYLTSGQRLKPDDVLSQVQTVGDLRALIASEDRERTQYFDWGTVAEHLASQLSSAGELEELDNVIWTGSWLDDYQLAKSLTALSKRFLQLGDRASAWTLSVRALDTTKPSGWDPYFDDGAKHAAIRQLIAIDEERARERIIERYAHDLSERFRAPGRIIPHFYDVLTLLSGDVPITEVWSAIELYLDELFASIPEELQPAWEAILEEQVSAPENDTADHAIADLLSLYLDHPSYSVAQGAVRACTAALTAGSEVVKAALGNALVGTDQTKERALMVLDAVSMEDPAIVIPYNSVLEHLCLSSNFTIRLIASGICARVYDGSPIPPVIERKTPAIYTLHLPPLAIHRTDQTVDGNGAPVAIGDPAFILQPLDIEARVIAEAAGLPEDNVLYRAAQLYSTLQMQRAWLAGNKPLDPKKLSRFLDEIGLHHDHYKPHIAPARHALGYVVGELYDGGHLPPAALQLLPKMLIHYDPVFILQRPQERPSCVDHMGEPINDRSFMCFPDSWTETAEDSLSLLRPRASDGRTILGEWTRLSYLEEMWPKEERVSVIRAVSPDELWDGFEADSGNPPFAGFRPVQMVDYPHLEASLDHLVIAHRGYDFETPGAHWLAFNPAVGRALGWQSVPGGWFRWVDERGTLVVESVWWRDGPVHQSSVHLRVETGSGWLVLMTERGFEEIVQWAGCVGRGGVVRRSKGQYGEVGRRLVTGVLSI